MATAGLVLAAGRGSRFGGPKALARIGGRSFVQIAVDALTGGGCAPVHVVVGAAAVDVSTVLPRNAIAVQAAQWREGIGASLAVGLGSLRAVDATGVVIHLVDLPDVGPGVVARLVEGADESSLVRATYGGRAGHPVLVGRAWWTALAADIGGTRGAREFLRGRAAEIECSDLASGFDVDSAADLQLLARTY